MPRFNTSKESLKGTPPLPPGIVTVRLDGFKPKFTKDGDSVNLNPVLKIINDSQLNDRTVREFLNTKAGWTQIEFAHGFGLDMVEDGPDSVHIPGAFLCKEHKDADCQCNPETNWQYVGPLVGKTARIELAEVADKNNPARKYTNIKRYFCQLPNCTHEHRESLL